MMVQLTPLMACFAGFLMPMVAEGLVYAPPSTWDSQIHIIDQARFPIAADAAYTPGNYTVDDARRFDESMGMGHTVVVQPSIYDYDNSCMLDALRRLGTDYVRGVAVYDPANTTTATLREWHGLGVRGARLNIVTTGVTLTKDQLNQTLTAYADSFKAAGLNWIIELAVKGSVIDMLEDIIPALGPRVIVDHMGYPAAPDNQTTITDPYAVAGFATLIKLINQGKTFVKLSAPYRSTSNWTSLDPVVSEFLRVGGMSRVVFGTDWPHVLFEGLDIRPWVEQVLGLCEGDEALIKRVFAENSKDLFDARSCSSGY
jgi:predicted TIM-barrel fold metal-dependent hydrolase